MSERLRTEPMLLHQFKNHLTVIAGFCEMILATLAEGDLRTDILQIQQSAEAATALLPELAQHFRD